MNKYIEKHGGHNLDCVPFAIHTMRSQVSALC